MDAKQFELFKQITVDYFAKLSPDVEPSLGEAYMEFGEPTLLDYTSLVKIQGEYHGCIYITSPVPMLESLLDINGEPEVSRRTLEDMCRELSNVLAGNAGQAFGGNWHISVPHTLTADQWREHTLPESTFVMPIHWRGAHALLAVGLELPPERPAETDHA